MLISLSATSLLPLAQRPLLAHKGDFGHVLVVGGDIGMGGAALLAGLFAARTGAGKVSIATRPEHIAAMISKEPCLMPKPVLTHHDLTALFTQASVLVIGPGLGRSSWSDDLFTAAMKQSLPKVIDADALFYLKQHQLHVGENAILTPHPGEAAMLLDLTLKEVQQNREAAVKALHTRYGGVAVLKGSGTLIYTGSALYICEAGNPGMASGGMGDALSGIIGALLAQGLTASKAAQTGVLAHALAGDAAAQAQGEIGLLASDLLVPLRQILNKFI